jgi:hypothetical protein
MGEHALITAATAAPVSQPVESRAAKMIRDIFESGRPLTYVRSSEEHRVARILRQVGSRLATPPVPVWTWTLTEGMRPDGEGAEVGTHAARGALDFIAGHTAAAIFHLKDFHEPLRESSEIRRRLRDLYASCLDQRKFIVITSPVRSIPEEIERSVIFIELRPPDVAELEDFLREEIGRRDSRGPGADDSVIHQLAVALQGLTLDDARYAIRRALVASPSLGPGSVAAVLEEKRLLVNRSGYIEFVPGGTSITDVGGLESLKKWLL